MNIGDTNEKSKNKIGRSLYSHRSPFSFGSFPSDDNIDSPGSIKSGISPVDLSKFELIETKTVCQLSPDKTIIRKIYRTFSFKSLLSGSQIDIKCLSDKL